MFCLEHGQAVATLLRSEPAQGALSAFVFWDAKRPITVRLLNHLDLDVLARP
jgi:hypothetical protein